MAKETDAKITVSKETDFSEWFTQLMKKGELADIRFNIKGFPVYMPWATQSIRKITRLWEETLEKKGHEPVIMPTLIPESNFHKEADHIEGFSPDVFWVTHGGEKEFEEKYALRPTSETVFYDMFKYWITSHNDLPFKRYQSANVFRYESKMTRPFMRTRELHWIETHCAFATKEDAMNQVKEDMQITHDLLYKVMALPHIFFQRPQWDKFPGAYNTFAADVLLPSGKVLQLPSTHLIDQKFTKAFDITFVDKDETTKTPFTTCYGPCHSRNYGALITFHGDDKGLVLPFDIAPKQIVIIPLFFKGKEEGVKEKAQHILNVVQEQGFSALLDDRTEVTPGRKFNEWEMKGVPIRIEIGPRDIEQEAVSLFRRDTGTKEIVALKSLIGTLKDIKNTFTNNLIEKANLAIKEKTINAETKEDIAKYLQEGYMVRTCIESIDLDWEPHAIVVEKELGGEVRGVAFLKNEPVFCKDPLTGNDAKYVVYIAKSH